jgi:hypothetical protein
MTVAICPIGGREAVDLRRQGLLSTSRIINQSDAGISRLYGESQFRCAIEGLALPSTEIWPSLRLSPRDSIDFTPPIEQRL